MLASIQATEYQREVTLVLQMLVCSNQRLTLEACNDAILVRPEEISGFSARDQFFDSRDIVNLCSGLVTTVWSDAGLIESQYLQLAHASVREYLSSQEVIQPFRSQLEERHAKACLLRLCHVYLCYIDWSIVTEKPEELDQIFPLADWAAATWPEHARFLEAVDDDALASIIGFLRQACVLSGHLFRYSIAQYYWADRTQCYPLYMAALMGFQRSSRRLMQSDWVDTLKRTNQKYLQSTESSLDSAAMQPRLDASLLAASARGHTTIVQELLAQGARPDVFRFRRYSEEYTALLVASKLGHTEVVRLLIEAGASVNYTVKPSHKTALYEASNSGHNDVVKFLLTNKADPGILSDGWSPLKAAIFQGHVAVAKALISGCVSSDNQPIIYEPEMPPFRPRLNTHVHKDFDLDSNTLLMLAVRQGDIDMIQLLLDNGSSVEDTDDRGQTVLHEVAQSGDIVILRMILHRGALIDALGPRGTALTVAARLGRCSIVLTLLDWGADLSDCKWHAPLLAAAYEEHFDIVEHILLHGIQINEFGSLGTALYQAVWNGLETLVKILLKHGAEADAHEEGTRTPLQIATAQRRLGVMLLLIEGGADIDRDAWPGYSSYHDPRMVFPRSRSDKAWLRWLQINPGSTLRQAGHRKPWEAAELLSRALTPLQIAVMKGSSEAVKLLLDSGANFDKGQWYTPLQIAVSIGYQNIAEKLLRSGAYMNIAGLDITLLELATRHKHETTVRLLIEHGAAVKGSDKTSNDPLQLVALHGHVRTAAALLTTTRFEHTNRAHVRREIDSDQRHGSALGLAVYAEKFESPSLGGHDRLEVVRLLLKHGFFNKSDWVPALHHVVQQGYRRYLHLFLEQGVDVNESYTYYWRASIADTPQFTSFKLLRVAAFSGHDGMIRLLLHCGAEIDDDSQGNCALASAAAGQQESTMRLLVKRGANIDLAMKIARGWTDSGGIIRSLRCLYTPVKSPLDYDSEWQELDSSLLLDKGFLQPPGEHTFLESRDIPLIVVEDGDSDPLGHPLEVLHHDTNPEFDQGHLGRAPDCLNSEW
jgi:ankyrin repeat protein